MMMLNSVRARLTLWYLFVFGVLLIAFSIFIYTLLSKNLYERLDHSLENSAQVTATEFQSEIREFNGDASAGALQTLIELQLSGIYTAIFEGDKLLASSYPDRQQPYPLSTFSDNKKKDREVFFQTVGGFGEEGARLAIVSWRENEKEFWVTVAEPLYDLTEQLESVRRIFYIGLPTILLVAGISGFLLAKKSFTPVVRMSNQAKRISATNLQERLVVNNSHDELGQLATVFNELLSRLDQSFANMREFMADASHELRTPLAIIRGEAEVTLSQERSDSEYKDSLIVIQDEAKRLSSIVEDMMALARAEAGQRQLNMQEFYLNDLVEEVCRAMQVLAANKDIVLTLDSTGDVPFLGDEDMIRRLLLNLLDNAIKYTPSNGSVSVKVVDEQAGIKLLVTDTGAGIPAEAAPYIFERFYRVDKARSRADGGSGLGLAIAKWVAEAHKGSIELTSQPGQGSTFIVFLQK
jgi:heavy metal sensor kinase